MGLMTAVMKESAAPGVTVRQAAIPAPGPEEFLARVDTAGICGSDLHVYEWIPEYRFLEPHLPTILGHEITATVAEVADGARVRIGDRVAIRPSITCGECDWCQRGQPQRCPTRVRLGYERPGGLADYLVAPIGNAYLLPATADVEAASLMEPLTVVVHALRGVRLRPGSIAAVIGAGAIGLLATELLAARRPAELACIGIPADQAGGGLALAQALGARGLVTGSGEVDRMRGTCDVVVVAAGAPQAMRLAAELAARGGLITVAGLGIGPAELDVDQLVRREITISGSFGNTPQDWLDARDAIANGMVKGAGVVSHVAAFADAEHAFDLLVRHAARKVCLTPNGKLP